MTTPKTDLRGSEGLLRRTIQRVYTGTRNAVWKLPVTRWAPAAHLAVRLGFWARNLLRLAPSEESLGIVHGHQIYFGPTSECYFEMTRGFWEPGVTYLFETLLKPGMVVVDAGAHIGYFALLGARQVGPQGWVYAFEPAPKNYALLTKNIELNGYQNIVALPYAVSGHNGRETFFLHPDSVAHSLGIKAFGSSSEAIMVEATTLDRFFEAKGWPSVQLVKLDIEGAEPAALEGMTGLLHRNKTVRLILEYVPYILERAGSNPRHFLNRLRDLGFTIRIIAGRGKLSPLTDKVAGSPGLRAELLCERNLG